MNQEAIAIKLQAGIQAIELPKQYKIDDDRVYLKKTGNIISIIPFHNAWQNTIESLNEFSADFMEQRNQPPTQTRESF